MDHIFPRISPCTSSLATGSTRSNNNADFSPFENQLCIIKTDERNYVGFRGKDTWIKMI